MLVISAVSKLLIKIFKNIKEIKIIAFQLEIEWFIFNVAHPYVFGLLWISQ